MTKYGRIRSSAAAATALAAIGAAVVATGGVSPAASAPNPTLSEAQVLSIANAASARAGDAAPSSIQYSEGPRDRANLVSSGEVVPGTASSYLITVLGHFTAPQGLTPEPASAGTPPPSGQGLTNVPGPGPSTNHPASAAPAGPAPSTPVHSFTSAPPPPTGSVLTLVVDASSGQVTDLGIQNTVPNLASLGSVTTAK